MRELICGKLDLREIFEYHGASMCLPECTDEFHDDTCLVGLKKRMQRVLTLLESEVAGPCGPEKVEQDA